MKSMKEEEEQGNKDDCKKTEGLYKSRWSAKVTHQRMLEGAIRG